MELRSANSNKITTECRSKYKGNLSEPKVTTRDTHKIDTYTDYTEPQTSNEESTH